MSTRLVSKWSDKRLRVGWTIRTRNGGLGVITWARGACFMYRPVTATTESEIESQIAQIRATLGL